MNVIVLLVCVWMFPTNEFVISSYNKGETTKISYPRSKRHGHRGRGCGHSGCMGPVHGSVHGSHKGTGCGERGCDGGGGHDFRSHHQYHASSSSGCGSDGCGRKKNFEIIRIYERDSGSSCCRDEQPRSSGCDGC
ncbi:hypothetical protein RB195_020888 [Necator americanus]|uniref:Uncharacterized protein n=1 Tax=Necator americanus TaxID=51031 RepID=A0ABR1CL65_NECAM